MKRLRFVSGMWLPLALVAAPVIAQPSRPAQPAMREASRLQLAVMEGALQHAVEEVQSRALEALQVAAGMPAMFTFDTNSRARGFRLEGYGVFFDVDLPPIPRSVEWQLKVLDTGAALAPEIEQLRQQAARVTDARARASLEQIAARMQTKIDAGNALGEGTGQAGDTAAGAPGARPTLVDSRSKAPADPFGAYVAELKRTLQQVVLDYGTTVRLGADDWLTVAAREMAPKLMPGNPTEATITLRIKGSTLAALKAGQLSTEEAAKRIEVREVF